MAKTNLSGANFVMHGYGQVEPNHLSAQRTGQIYAQLPAAANIDVLQNGQFVKYDYANGEVNFSGMGEWMLVFNEVKLYRDHENYDDFAMKKEDYVARVYSPIDGENPTYANARNYQGVVNEGPDIVGTSNPFVVEQFASPKKMPTGTNMVPRVFKTNVGDIYTSNLVTWDAEDNADYAIAAGDLFAPAAANGILTYFATPNDNDLSDYDMVWQVAKVYTLADRQRAVKLIRIK